MTKIKTLSLKQLPHYENSYECHTNRQKQRQQKENKDEDKKN